MIKCINISIIYSQNGNADSVKALVHNTAFLWWQKSSENVLTKEGLRRAILADLSKVFDYILHDILIAKLATYGFGYHCLRIIESFLTNRQQRTKINDTFSRYSKIIYGVPQGSILGALLFNIWHIFLAQPNLILQVIRTVIYHIMLILI